MRGELGREVATVQWGIGVSDLEVIVEIQLLVGELKDARRYLAGPSSPLGGLSWDIDDGLPGYADRTRRVRAITAIDKAAELLGSMVPSHEEAEGNDPVEIGD